MRMSKIQTERRNQILEQRQYCQGGFQMIHPPIQGQKKKKKKEMGLLQIGWITPSKRKRLLGEKMAILHALLVSYEVKMSIRLCGIAPDKHVQMDWISSSVPWVTAPSFPPSFPLPQWHSTSVATVTQSASNP